MTLKAFELDMMCTDLQCATCVTSHFCIDRNGLLRKKKVKKKTGTSTNKAKTRAKVWVKWNEVAGASAHLWRPRCCGDFPPRPSGLCATRPSRPTWRPSCRPGAGWVGSCSSGTPQTWRGPAARWWGWCRRPPTAGDKRTHRATRMTSSSRRREGQVVALFQPLAAATGGSTPERASASPG